MNSRNPGLQINLILIAFVICLMSLFGCDVCFSEDNKKDKRSLRETNPAKNKWIELLKRVPYPYTIPLLSKKTVLDGTYVKKAKKEGEIVPCRRCPDWLPFPGIWKLNLNKGTYRIYHNTTSWRSIGSYIVAGNRIIFANDPCCIHGIGMYTWKLEEEKLLFNVIDDDCAIKLRALNLMEVPWDSCQPPGIEAAMTEQWQKPQGCD
ncbi:MAG: hypothetical protein JSW04_06025 [Desulfobacterales bacterium]|nr:MAG: hypothetical protein JSW04_06025 [Desulfobacterales bacterium]